LTPSYSFFVRLHGWQLGFDRAGAVVSKPVDIETETVIGG